MKVTKEKIENCQAYLNVEMEEAEMEAGIDDAYKRLARKANIPGFRKGKAPRQVMEHYIGKASVLEEAIDRMLPKAYEDALTEQEIEPYAQPSVEITKTEPLAFKATVPLQPEVEAGDYKDIRLEPMKLEVTEDRISEVLDELRHQNASWEPVDRAVEYDDLVTADLFGTVEDRSYLQKVGAQVQVVKDSVSPAPGFFEQVAGMEKDEEKEFTLPFPDDYPNTEVAGKEGKFKVKITEIKVEKLPELDDSLAPLVSAEFKTLDDLRAEVVKGLTARDEENIRMDYEERIINAAVKAARIQYPPVTVDYEVERIMREQERQLSASSRSMDDYLKNIGKTEQQLRDDLKPIAVRNVEASLVLSKIAEIEDVQVTEEDIDNGIRNMCNNVPADQQEAFYNMLNTEATRQSLSSQLRTRKTIERLSEIAKTEDDKPKTPENEEEPPAAAAAATEEEAPATGEAPAAEDPENEGKEETK